jgi:hypothetical protein
MASLVKVCKVTANTKLVVVIEPSSEQYVDCFKRSDQVNLLQYRCNT